MVMGGLSGAPQNALRQNLRPCIGVPGGGEENANKYRAIALAGASQNGYRPVGRLALSPMRPGSLRTMDRL
jgi:hypothetical protein